MLTNSYHYRGIVNDVIDGDTVVASIDLGLDCWLLKQKFRLAAINAPELTPKKPTSGLGFNDWCKLAGVNAKIKLIERLGGTLLADCTIDWRTTPMYTFATLKDRKEKYGRYLVMIYDGDTCINSWMVEQGLALPYKE